MATNQNESIGANLILRDNEVQLLENPRLSNPRIHRNLAAMRDDTRAWIESDFRHCWHPFTRQAEWCAPGHEPVVITEGRGVWLIDSEGRKYIDGNSSIWTNIHGHSHPKLVEAVRDQVARLAHSSFLGFTHPLAVELAEALCGFFPPDTLERVFFSDDGSTAIECALKMALQYRQLTGQREKRGFVTFENGYHGDTLGAASISGVSRFSDRFAGLGHTVHRIRGIEELENIDAREIAACVIEPIMQGVNQMRPWPQGMLRALRAWCDANDVHLILDEVMTGFGRTGAMFGCQLEEVVPDFLCLAKGLTGGLMPLAATLTTGPIYDAFLGGAERAFYYGHSYTANPLGCAAALASLEIFKSERVLEALPEKTAFMAARLCELQAALPIIHEVRQVGLIAGIELRRPDGKTFPVSERLGERVCHTAREFGLLTRPILDTIVLMPPLCTSLDEIAHAAAAIHKSLEKI
jgi:adenosylmethionine-8-amino-7-oxononanoate aminotransferase